MHSVQLYSADEIHLKSLYTVLANALWNIHASIEMIDYFDDEEDQCSIYMDRGVGGWCKTRTKWNKYETLELLVCMIWF